MMHCLKSSRRTLRGLYLQGEGPDKFRLSVHHAHLALLGEHIQAVGQLRDHAALPGSQAIPVDLRRPENDAAGRHILGILDDLRRVQQRLRGNAADIEAHSSQYRPALDQRYFET